MERKTLFTNKLFYNVFLKSIFKWLIKFSNISLVRNCYLLIFCYHCLPIMSVNLSTTVFLSLCSEVQAPLRNDLASVLSSAGMNVIPESKLSDELSLASIKQNLSAANCSILILFPDYGPASGDFSGASLSKFQFLEAKKQLEINPSFKLIVWLPPSTDLLALEPAQMEFINEVRNNITKNMVFSNAFSTLQLVDDLRSLMDVKEETVFDVSATDIFLISNELDENEANEIIDMLSDIVPVEKLSIIQDSDMDYSEYCSQQIGKSKLAVVYFKESAEWALPFAQQVWKKIGGASSHTPILLIGDENPDTNSNKKLRVPKVISLIVAGELIPLEIKVQFDKVVDVLNK